MAKIKLSGFNNLTKTLNFCIYDICYTQIATEKKDYIFYINKKYNANNLATILTKTCAIINANILNITHYDYEPQGASVTILISEGANTLESDTNSSNINLNGVAAHLDKSHICIHTYPEIDPTNGLCTFRADIDISTCGNISPLKALNYLIKQFKSDIVTVDYRIRGFTRDFSGKKHYIDHKINSIQNFISTEIKKHYHTMDINMYKENIFHTKMILKDFTLQDYLFDNKKPLMSESESNRIAKLIQKEMQEIYHGYNI